MASQTQEARFEFTERGRTMFRTLELRGRSLKTSAGQVGQVGGASRERAFPSASAARAAFVRELGQHLKDGWASAGDTPLGQAPVLWQFKTRSAAYGLFVEKERCWVGTRDGSVYALSHQGKLQRQLRLSGEVNCLVADAHWRYAGCSDGKVYDLTGKTPRLAYEVTSSSEVLWLDIASAALVVSDEDGAVTVFDHEGEQVWRKQSAGTDGWMVRADDAGIYQGHDKGVTSYAWEKGRKRWHSRTSDGVFFGYQEGKTAYAGTVDNHLYALDKRTGRVLARMGCEASVYSCAVIPGGAVIYAGDDRDALYAFDKSGRRLWKLKLPCGTAFSMQYFDGRLYVASMSGYLACIDVRPAALQKALAGQLPRARTSQAPAPAKQARTDALERTKSAKGVVLTCVKEHGRLRIKVTSKGYRADWHVQFPKDIRREGARYVVDQVVEAGRGHFYRVLGEIRELV